MSKTSVLFKVYALAVLLALLVAALPTQNAVAKDTTSSLEKKWSHLVNAYHTEYSKHQSVHHWVDAWLKKAPNSKKAEVQKHLDMCNSSIVGAGIVVSKHAGFDAKGELVDRAAAIKSIKDLRYYLQKHAGSAKNLKEHINADE
jgi:hypothetical protein